MYNPNIAHLESKQFLIGNLIYDASSQSLSLGTQTIYLRNKLNEVLFHMVANESRLVSRSELIEKVWDGNYYTGAKGVTHSVCKLRKKLNDLGVTQVKIRTLPKQGYYLSVN
ncbi:winged helix-turn-helix domain-containing protein [Aliikangiella coralliicola]|uniref:Response regulator transcription factor n=1 Tax=Aliikangiella coralliicola TaxID=2592383 RepID=A0A545UGQ0_9GAMM|nr:winged helix-turn-helix domain-containing protein [Aliikangiella coralliicola]TQV88615.1 response regulator transcription factor [Aliikangiella coralliicola]